MMQVSRGLYDVKFLFNDDLVVGHTKVEYNGRLRAVLDHLIQYGIALNLVYCLVSVSRSEFLWKIIH